MGDLLGYTLSFDARLMSCSPLVIRKGYSLPYHERTNGLSPAG